jgi:hypothetical protein
VLTKFVELCCNSGNPDNFYYNRSRDRSNFPRDFLNLFVQNYIANGNLLFTKFKDDKTFGTLVFFDSMLSTMINKLFKAFRFSCYKRSDLHKSYNDQSKRVARQINRITLFYFSLTCKFAYNICNNLTHTGILAPGFDGGMTKLIVSFWQNPTTPNVVTNNNVQDHNPDPDPDDDNDSDPDDDNDSDDDNDPDQEDNVANPRPNATGGGTGKTRCCSMM